MARWLPFNPFAWMWGGKKAPTAVLVTDAGEERANGTYLPSGTWDGVPQYVNEVHSGCIEFCLFHQIMDT